MQCERVNDEKNIIQYHRALTFDESEDMSERHGGGLPTEEELLELLRNSYTGYGEENPGAMYPGEDIWVAIRRINGKNDIMYIGDVNEDPGTVYGDKYGYLNWEHSKTAAPPAKYEET